MAVYAATEDNASPAASGQQGTLISGGSGQTVLATVRRGRSTTSTTLTGGREKIQRSTGGATPTAGAVEQHNTRSPAKASTYDSAWTTAPTLSGNALVFTSIGIRQEQTPDWRVPRPWAGICLINGEELDQVSSFTSSAATVSLHWREDRPAPTMTRRGGRPRRNGLWGHIASDTQYVHKTGTGLYDVYRVATRNFVARVRTARPASTPAWGNFYSGGGGTVALTATGRAVARAIVALPVARAAVGTAQAITRGQGALPSGRPLVGSAQVSSRSRSQPSMARVLVAAALVVARSQGALPLTRGLAPTGQAVARAQSAAIVSRQLIAQAQARAQGQDALIRAVALIGSGRSAARGSGVISVGAIVLLIASALARSRGQSATPVARQLSATDRSATFDQAALIRAIVLIGFGKSTAQGASVLTTGAIVLLIATAFARARLQAVTPVSRLLIASALARTQARDALVRAVALAAQAQARGVGVASVPEVRRLVSTALASAHAAVVFAEAVVAIGRVRIEWGVPIAPMLATTEARTPALLAGAVRQPRLAATDADVPGVEVGAARSPLVMVEED